MSEPENNSTLINPQPDETRGGPLMACLAAVIGLIISLVMLEVLTRVAVDDGMNFDLEMWKYAKHIKTTSPVDAIGHQHLPNRSGVFMGVPVSTNSIGQRDREFDLAKPKNTVRVVMLGDSLTFGWGVKIEDTPSKMLEARLNKVAGGKQYEVINTGVGNYNTSQQVEYFLTKGQAFKPDIVVLNYFINDAEMTPRRRSGGLIENSYAAVFIMGRIDLLLRSYLGGKDWREYYSDLYRSDARGWKNAKAEVARLAAFCKQNGIDLLIANYPELHELKPYPFRSVTTAIQQLAADNGAAFVDLLPGVADFEPESLWVSPEDAHPNAKANTVFAATLESQLRKAFPRHF